MWPRFSLLFFITITSCANAQHYKIVESVNTDLVISKHVDLYDIHYKFYNEYLFFFQVKRFEQDSSNVFVSILNIKNGAIINKDTIYKLPAEFRITDLSVTNDYILIVSDDTYIIKNRNSLYTYNNTENKRFQYCKAFSEDLILLYLIYNFHPLDGSSGLFMYTLNPKKNIIVSSNFQEFKPILLSILNKNWLTINRNKVIVVSPLTGHLISFDSSLEKIITYDSIDVFSIEEIIRNKIIHNYLDSIFIKEHGRLSAKIKSLSGDDLRNPLKLQSIIYTKDYVWKLVDTIRKNYSFIERILALNDSIIAFTVSRSGYDFMYRDLYYYNMKTKTISVVFNKWRCLPKDTINSAEDFFTINITLGATRYPYFKKENEIYSVSMYNPNLFKNGLKDEIAEFYLKDIIQNNYRINILKYAIESSKSDK